MRDKSIGSFRGMGVGDALGAPVEFKSPGSFPPVTDYQPTPMFGIDAGDWTDDTIMAFCMADGIIEAEGYDSYTVMKKYVDWYDNGYNSPNGRLFDIGNQTSRAIHEYKKDPNFVEFTDSAGNGTVMRLAPAVISTMNLSTMEAADVFDVSARDTHNSYEAAEATVLFGLILRNLIKGVGLEESLDRAKRQTREYTEMMNYPDMKIAERVYDFTDEEAHNGGYVIPSLGTAIWAMKNSDSFREAVLKVVNLGRDSDTVGAITGQMAGALYGDSQIPTNWVDNLHRTKDFESLTDELLQIEEPLINSRVYMV